MTAQTHDWPADAEWIGRPTEADMDAERRHWMHVEAMAELDAWTEERAALGLLDSFEAWPLEDLLDELATVRTLTPDQHEVIDELTVEIRRRAA